MIRAIVMDVDGTLTDGGIYMSAGGELFKRFDVKDGYAIANMLPEKGIIPIIITGRKSEILLNRCQELNIEHVIQGCKDKVNSMKGILKDLGIPLEETAYIGDDLNDLDCMRIVAVKGCPHDAADEIKSICDYVCQRNGGYGAVREFITHIAGRG